MKILHENNSEFISELTLKFGNDVVFSSTDNFDLTVESVKTLFDVLNRFAFDGKLPAVPIELQKISEQGNTQKQDKNNAQGTVETKQTGGSFELGFGFQPETYKLVNYTQKIFITDFDGQNNFSQTLNALAHEMIHLWLAVHPIYKRLNLIDAEFDVAGIKTEHIDPHHSGFRKKMDELNAAFGLAIEIKTDPNKITVIKAVNEKQNEKSKLYEIAKAFFDAIACNSKELEIDKQNTAFFVRFS